MYPTTGYQYQYPGYAAYGYPNQWGSYYPMTQQQVPTVVQAQNKDKAKDEKKDHKDEKKESSTSTPSKDVKPQAPPTQAVFLANSKFSIRANTSTDAPTLANMPRDQYVIDVEGKRKCSLCNVEFTSTMCELSHLQGKRHRMAMQGKITTRKKKKKSGPTQDWGRCDVCDVDYTSEVQRNSHVQGKKHVKNMQMASRGMIPPVKRRRTSARAPSYQFPGYPNSNNMLQGSNGQPLLDYGVNVQNIQAQNNIVLQSMQQQQQQSETTNNNEESKSSNSLEHEKLQKEVEEAYNTYLQIAKTDSDRAGVLYKAYQDKYNIYIRAYNEFARNYRDEQERKQQKKQKEKEEARKNRKRDEGEPEMITTQTTIGQNRDDRKEQSH